jgi:hypothetical protein
MRNKFLIKNNKEKHNKIIQMFTEKLLRFVKNMYVLHFFYFYTKKKKTSFSYRKVMLRLVFINLNITQRPTNRSSIALNITLHF